MSGWTYYSGNWYWLGDKNLSEDGRFGKYDATSSELDRILFERPALVTVAAAGNDRNEGPPTQPHEHFEYTDNQRYSSQTVRPLDGQKRAGLDTLIGLCIAKNAICVGSIHDVTQAGNIQITDYSNWGPTDDFRIKPDLVANGQVLLSTSEADDTAYAEKSGTSMATPVVSGITALLSQHFEKARARSPLSVELKAILIHTAKDAGVLGPDPVFGWGSVNALLAGHVIALPNQHLIEGVSIGAGQEWSRTLTGMVGQLARITVVWSDPPAPANADGVNDQTATLINDIDVVLMAPDGKQYFPYSLNRTNPLLPATKTGPNHTDNVEVIDAPGQAGAWKLSIRGHVFKAAGPQKCSIVASGFQLTP